MTEPPELERLLERARSGDRGAFDALAEQTRVPLLADIRRRIGERLAGKLEADDILQETYLTALTSLDRFQWRGEGSLLAWLRGIARRTLLHSARQLGVRSCLRLEREPAASGVSPSRHQRRRERLERLERSVEELDEDYRVVVRLSRIEGLKVREIAERMGRSESSVRNLLLRAMRRLRESFGDTESLSLPEPPPGAEGGSDER